MWYERFSNKTKQVAITVSIGNARHNWHVINNICMLHNPFVYYDGYLFSRDI